MFVNRYGIFKRIPSKFYVPIKLNMLSHFQVPDSAHFSLREKNPTLWNHIPRFVCPFVLFLFCRSFFIWKEFVVCTQTHFKRMHFTPTFLKFPNKSKQSFRSNILSHKSSSTLKLINKYIPSCNVFPAFLFDHAWFKLKGCYSWYVPY